jgi:hypothetical protein
LQYFLHWHGEIQQKLQYLSNVSATTRTTTRTKPNLDPALYVQTRVKRLLAWWVKMTPQHIGNQNMTLASMTETFLASKMNETSKSKNLLNLKHSFFEAGKVLFGCRLVE